MIVTSHAAVRWDERFPGKSLADTFASAKCRVGKKTKAKIRASCLAHDDFMRGSFKGIYYQMTPDHIVFVIQPPEKIITVFKLEKP
ncbi:hypothetical protein ACIPEN_14435 [Herbaspirillum chlorophenolicum]|uniref:Uncharacterized protein n=1 Tax=Herbaspirillum chlorophenolicum TaxID=211589 RepID=A0ABW8F159_9BURK